MNACRRDRQATICVLDFASPHHFEMSNPLTPSKNGGFARTFDYFSYKRLVDMSDLTKASPLGASLTIAGVLLLVFLVFAETFAYIAPEVKTEVGLAVGSGEPLPVTFNITFPHIPCHLLTLELSDAMGLHASNVTSPKILKYKIDGKTGQRLLAGGGAAAGGIRYESRTDQAVVATSGAAEDLHNGNFNDFVASKELVMVAYGANWCVVYFHLIFVARVLLFHTHIHIVLIA
jgi:hypothetical protein